MMTLSAFCLCIGQLLWKRIAAYGLVMLFLGFFIYSIGALVMLIAYRFGDLSVLQPMNSLCYVFMLIFASVLLHESITLLKVAGVVVIMIGVVLIAGSDMA